MEGMMKMLKRIFLMQMLVLQQVLWVFIFVNASNRSLLFVIVLIKIMIILYQHVGSSGATKDADVTITFSYPKEETNDKEGFAGGKCTCWKCDCSCKGFNIYTKLRCQGKEENFRYTVAKKVIQKATGKTERFNIYRQRRCTTSRTWT